jgi:methionyl-tRNA formyltransferase
LPADAAGGASGLAVGFAGTPAFAATALAAILAAGHPVRLVLTRADRPQGRGLKLVPSPVKALAQAHGLPVLQPPTLKTPEARASIVVRPLDVLVVAAYGLILPPAILAWPRFGCINIHASLLPRWRGAAPIQRALLAGDDATGVTIMQMDVGLDTGPLLAAVPVPIDADTTAGALEARLAAAGAGAIVAALARLARGERLAATPQPEAGATYAPKIGRADAAIAWTAPATAIERQLRALDPAPGAYAELGGEVIKLWRGECVAGRGAPGAVLPAERGRLVVACGEGALSILELQPAGGRRMAAAAFLAGRPFGADARFADGRA